MKETTRKKFFIGVLILSYLTIYIFNLLTPYMSDDFLSISKQYQSLGDILRAQYTNYMTWNGRTVVQIIMECFLCGPKWLFNICNSICYVYMIFLMYCNVQYRKRYDFSLFILINILVWLCGVSFSQTVLWESGACNYLWGMAIVLTAVTVYRKWMKEYSSMKHQALSAFGIFFLCFFAGWCNENTSGGALLILLFTFGIHVFQKRKVSPWMLSGLAGMMIGLLFMVCAPGNRIRGALMRAEEEHQGILAIVGRLLKINKAFAQYLLPLLGLTVILLVYFYLRKYELKKYVSSLLFIFVSIATSYALIMTPQPMDRAYFGAVIFAIIGLAQAVTLIDEKDIYLYTMKIGGIIVLLLYMYTVYSASGANLTRLYREIRERDTYVEEQKALGNTNLTLPMLRPEFDDKYSFLMESDINEDSESFENYTYQVYYGVERIVGVSRSEWTEY